VQKQQAVHTAGEYGWEFYFSPIKYAIPIPIKTIPISIPIPTSSQKLLPFPWESHGNPTGMGIPIPMHTSTVDVIVLGNRWLQTCERLLDRAFTACDTGIVKAQSQCLGVMSELGNVYHHARDVLDRINPERWAGARTPAQQPQQPQQPGFPGRRKRQLPPAFEDVDPNHPR